MSQIAWVELFVEEPSMEHALRALVPKIRPDLSERFQVHAFDGVDDMLQKLPDRLRGYAGWLPADWRIVVIRDEDRKQCIALKAEVEDIARRAGLMPKSRSGRGRFHVLTRIAIEELEAWLLGGGTWEALERVLQKAGHFLGGLPKVQVARETAAAMDPDRNTSRSFQAFRDGLRDL